MRRILVAVALLLVLSAPRWTHARPGIVPVRRATGNASSGLPATLPVAQVVYGGGPVLSNVRVVIVFWTANVDATVQTQIGDFYSDLVNGPFIDRLQEYGRPFPIGPGTVSGPIVIIPSHSSTVIDDSDIQAELAAQIAAGVLPAPDANTLFVVHFPPGIAVTIGADTSCFDFCGYHDFAESGAGGFAYAVIIDFSANNACNGACGDRSAFDDTTEVASHELMEAITDARPFTGWSYNQRTEIGDFCNFDVLRDQAYTPVAGSGSIIYQGQLGFSNAAALGGAGIGGSNGCVGYPQVPQVATVQHLFGIDASGGITHRVLRNFDPASETGQDVFPETWRDLGVVGKPAVGSLTCASAGGESVDVYWASADTFGSLVHANLKDGVTVSSVDFATIVFGPLPLSSTVAPDGVRVFAWANNDPGSIIDVKTNRQVANLNCGSNGTALAWRRAGLDRIEVFDNCGSGPQVYFSIDGGKHYSTNTDPMPLAPSAAVPIQRLAATSYGDDQADIVAVGADGNAYLLSWADAPRGRAPGWQWSALQVRPMGDGNPHLLPPVAATAYERPGPSGTVSPFLVTTLSGAFGLWSATFDGSGFRSIAGGGSPPNTVSLASASITACSAATVASLPLPAPATGEPITAATALLLLIGGFLALRERRARA
jgi:hypothetical protein